MKTFFNKLLHSDARNVGVFYLDVRQLIILLFNKSNSFQQRGHQFLHVSYKLSVCRTSSQHHVNVMQVIKSSRPGGIFSFHQQVFSDFKGYFITKQSGAGKVQGVIQNLGPVSHVNLFVVWFKCIIVEQKKKKLKFKVKFYFFVKLQWSFSSSFHHNWPCRSL